MLKYLLIILISGMALAENNSLEPEEVTVVEVKVPVAPDLNKASKYEKKENGSSFDKKYQAPAPPNTTPQDPNPNKAD